MTQRLSNTEARELFKQGKPKPIKQSQGSNAGKAPPLEQVRTAGLKLPENGYSDVKQDAINQIEELHRQADEELNHLTETEALPVWTFMKKCRYALEIVKLLKI